MLTLTWLRNAMRYSGLYAQWLHEQFTYEFFDQPLESWQREFAEGQHNGDWQCLIASEHGQLLGGACLANKDLPSRPDLGPWLACVFVAPSARNRGLANQLIEAICTEAKAQGVHRLYLHTQDRQQYYTDRGWAVVEYFEQWGKAHCLMVRALGV